MITATYYTATWHGTFDGTPGELDILLARAVDVVDNAIYLSGATVAEITDLRLQPRVYNAVCAQLDYIVECGGRDSMNDSGAESVSLGRYSYSGGSAGSSPKSCDLCEQARGYLLPTGLLYRGVDTF